MPTQVVFRSPNFSNFRDFDRSPPSYSLGNITLFPPPKPPVTKNIYYKQFLITQGHMGFLGTY